MNRLLVEPLEQRIIDNTLGIHSYAKSNPDVLNSFAQIVDSSLLPPDIGEPTEFGSLDEIRGQTEQLYGEVDDNLRDSGLIKQRLAGGIALARVLSGEAVPFAEQYETMTGVKPEFASQADIEAASKKVQDLLSQQGLEHTAEGHKGFIKRFGIKGAEIEGIFRGEIANTLPLLQRYVDCEPTDTRITIEPLDEQWVAFLEYKYGSGFNTRINSNTEMFPQTAGRVAGLAYHEFIGHVAQFTMWRDAIDAGEVSPVTGLITVHTPEMTQFEGVAHLAMNRFLPEGPWTNQFESAYDELRLMAFHNGHMAVNMGTMTHEEATDMVSELLPFEPIETVAGFINNATEDTLWKVYGACYYPGFKILKPLVGASNAKLKEVLPQIYGRPMLPNQMAELVAAPVSSSSVI